MLINTVFGVGAALLLARYRFRGRALLDLAIDLPISVSPIIVGLALVLAFGWTTGWFGPALQNAGLQVIFATPGMVLATAFVSLPLVVREVLPVLTETGLEQDQAARSLGANAGQRFVRITLPTIRWALAYGVVLQHRPHAGRVRCRPGGVGQRRRPDPDGDAAGRRAGRAVRTGRLPALGGADRGGGAVHRGHLAAPPAARRVEATMGIEARDITKRFGAFVALDEVNLDVGSGQLTALLGPSGGGKSTLLRIIGGLEEADSGSVVIDGVEVTGIPPQRRNVGFVFQHYAAFKHLSVYRNVAFGLEIRKRPKAEIRQRVHGAAGAGAPGAVRRPDAVPAVRRPAAADGAGPGAGRRAEGAAAGRAVRGAGRQGAQGAAGLAAPAARRGARHHRVRHPRPGGGAGGGRLAGGDQRRPDRAGRQPRTSSTTTRRTSS